MELFFHLFTAYIVSFADAHHIKFIFKELGIAQAEIHDPKNLVKFRHWKNLANCETARKNFST